QRLPQCASLAGAGPVDQTLSGVALRLHAIWRKVLGVERIRVNDDFFTVGGNSISAIRVIAAIYKEMGTKIPLSAIFEAPTIRLLARKVEAVQEAQFTQVPKAGAKPHYGLSSNQRRIYFLNQLALQSTAYNLPQVVRLRGSLSKERLEQVFNSLIDRHESLRTSVKMVQDEPRQLVHESVPFAIAHYEVGADYAANPGEPVDRQVRPFIRPFDLEKAPLLRAGLIRLADDEHLLLTDLHHIVSDGATLALLVEDFGDLYAGKVLPPLRLQYKDYVEWQNGKAQQEALRQQEAFWLGEFSAEVPVLTLPTDFPRTDALTSAGDTIPFSLDASLGQELQKLAEAEKVTVFALVFALFNVLLAKLSRQDDIVVGTPVLGRRHADLEGIAGLFVNTLPLRSFPRGEVPFKTFLWQVREKTIRAFENQEYAYDRLVTQVVKFREANRNPLFDVLFAFHNGGEQTADLAVPGLHISPYAFNSGESKFDLILSVIHADTLQFALSYKHGLFTESTIRRYIAYFRNLAAAVVKAPGERIGKLGFLPEEERTNSLYRYNDTRLAFPADKSVVQLFEEQAARVPHRVALEGDGNPISFGELNARANQVAGWLRDQGVGPGRIVALLLGEPRHSVIAMLAVLKARAAYLPVAVDLPRERVAYLLNDSHAGYLLSQTGYRDRLPAGSPVLDVESPAIDQYPTGNLGLDHDGQDAAYIIYTSGSTGFPKGVVIENHSLTNYILFAAAHYASDGCGSFPLFTAISFDLTITAIYTPLVTGGRILLYPAGEAEAALRSIVADNRADVVKLTPSHLKLMLQQSRPAPGRAALRRIIVGGEALETTLAAEAHAYFNGNVEIYNEYGPTEATVGCMLYRYDPADQQLTVPIGKPVQNAAIYLLDSSLQPVAAGVEGEICISGPVLARGYLNRPELTGLSFIDNPFAAGEKLYRTGDLARRINDQSIVFCGRADNQLKIRGYRVEPAEIEQALLAHEGVREVVVMAGRDEQEAWYVLAYFVADPAVTPRDLREALARKVPGYMVPNYFIPLASVPLTAHGKVDTRALPRPAAQAGPEYVSPRDALERQLAALWREQLKVDRPGITDNYFNLGGDSIRAIKLVAKIHKEINVKLTLQVFFRAPTIEKLAAEIRASGQSLFQGIEPAAPKEYYALTSSQKRIFVLQQLDAGGTAYNMTQVGVWKGEVVPARLEQAFRRLIERHESLRTSIALVDGEPFQKIHPEVDFRISYQETDRATAASLIGRFARPFDLTQAPLLRVGLFKVAAAEYLLAVDMHHLISDGVSHSILIEEFKQLYRAAALPPLRIQYKDFAEWHNRRIPAIAQVQGQYWLDQFRTLSPPLQLPADFGRPAFQRFEGSSLAFGLDGETTARLALLARNQEVTLFMLLSALYYVFLSKVTTQEDITIGTPIAGRRHDDLHAIVGLFINTLALKSCPQRDKPFTVFLQEVKAMVLGAFENQEYPYEALIEKVVPGKDTSRNPLFDVMFVLQDAGPSAGNQAIEHVEISAYQGYAERSAKFDLTLFALERETGLDFILEYNTSLFREETAVRFTRYLQNLVGAAVADPGQPIGAMEMLSAGEKAQLVRESDHTHCRYPDTETLKSR
ncbi:MAG: amino acid adenylation domain-containing protein, partial [Cytophagales bacterium]|nr:amino acid adenylation domain-containing protein [Cytophagales bacterium]